MADAWPSTAFVYPPPSAIHTDQSLRASAVSTPLSISSSRGTRASLIEEAKVHDTRSENIARALPPVDEGWPAWRFVINAFILETVIWGYSFTFGIIQVYLGSHEPFQSSSIAAISAVGTISLALQYMLPVFCILFFRKYPDWSRTVLWAAVAVSCGSFLISSWATAIWQLILLQGVLGGAAGAVLYVPVLLYLNEWFVERRGLASGIIFAGTGAGGVIFPFMVGALLDKVGFANTMRIWSAFTLVAFSIALTGVHPRLPIVKPINSEARGAFFPVDLRFLRSPVVLTMCATTFIFSLAVFPVQIYIPTYTVSLGSPLSGSIVLAAYNAASVLGQFGVGWLSDKTSYATIVVGLSIICALSASLSWGFADTLAKVFGFVILFGIFTPICSVWSAVARDVAGIDTQISSLVFCCFGNARGVASIVGPLIASGLYDQNGALGSTWGFFGFRKVIVFVAAMSLASVAGGLGLAVAKRVKRE